MTIPLPTFVTIPTTTFLMGTNESELSTLAKTYGGTRESYREESPQHRVTLASYAIATTPVTVALYAAYVAAGGATPSSWHQQSAFPANPVVNVTWPMANAFCTWLSQHTSITYTLPDEAQWECAARGSDGRQFPWGNTWDDTRAAVRGSCSALPPVASSTPGSTALAPHQNRRANTTHD
jgi:formylglycine-generating enzyme required for sulfatase activity